MDVFQQLAMTLQQDKGALAQLAELRAKADAHKSTSPVSHPLSLDPFVTIPERVEHNGKIRVEKSSIPGAGRGITVVKDVKAGEILFKINKPLLTAVDNGQYSLSNTCGNCFASKYKGVATVPNEKLKLLPCGRCKIVHYCGKKCQKEAWDAYHQYECRTLKRMNTWEWEDGKVVHMARVRLMVRLLELHFNDMIPEEQWAEIRSLSSNIELKKKGDKESYEGAQVITAGLRHYTATGLTESEVLELLLAVQNNELVISLPLLRPHGADYASTTPNWMRFGAAMDPFVAMVNHSCSPNIIWTFEGRELRVIASKPIVAGSEINFTYVDELGDFHDRRETLKKQWSFDCTCTLCQQGPQGICAPSAGDFGKRILELKNAGLPDSIEKLGEIERACEAFEKEGYSIDTYPMRWFYRCIWGGQTMRKEWEKALKTKLKIFYEIEPTYPSISLDERLDTLYHLCNTLTNHPPIKTGLNEENLQVIVTQLRLLHLRGIKLAYGADTRLAIFEAREEDKDSEKIFCVCMNLLLNWAGIAKKTEKELQGL